MAKLESKRIRVRKAPEERREEILDAAGSAFLSRGVSAATMDDVARGAGIAKGTVYLYFESKDALVAGLLGRYGADLVRIARSSLEATGTGPPMARFEAFMADLVDYHLDRQDLLRAVFHSTSPHGVDIDQLRGMLRGFVERGIGAGEFDVSDVALATEFVFDGLHGVLNAAFHQSAPDRHRLVSTLTELVAKTLAA